MDEPLKGLKFMSTKWTDPTRVKNLYKSTKWMNPTRDQIHVHKMDEPLEGLRFMSTKWTDPTRFKKPT